MSRSFVRFVGSLLLVCSVLSLAAQNEKSEKPIRLRNQTIEPKSTTRAVSSAPLSGLYVIQFNAGLKPEEREQLRGLGVDLLRYVPDDAFVARVNGIAESAVRSLPFVRFVGEYRPEHK